MAARKWLFGLLLSAALLTPLAAKDAHATTMTAQECSVATIGCPPGNTIAAGIRTNWVGILGYNRYALLPFSYFNGDLTFNGTVLAANLLLGGRDYIYLYGQGIGTQSFAGNGFYLNSIIQQAYRTPGGIGSFGAFNVGVCNGTATGAGDGSAMQPYVNNTPLLTINSVACSPFASFSGPQTVATGAITTLTAAVDMQFNPIAGGGAAITLPWGDDIPDPDLTTLNNDINHSDSLPTILGDLQTADPGLTQQTPEPATMVLLGSGLLGLGMLRRRRR